MDVGGQLASVRLVERPEFLRGFVFQVGFRAQTKNATEISEVDPLLLARVTNGFSVLMGQHQLHPFVFTTKTFS